jgi:membrane protease subunit (stomatin/prohibitin family)
MAVFDRIKFDAPSDDFLCWKFPGEVLKLGSQLVVNQSQEALFVRNGTAYDLFGPGTHTLLAANLPLLYPVVNLPFGGETPFSAEIWFINKTVKRDLRWGTQAPIPLIDPKYNYPISVRAFGRWGFRIKDSGAFVLQIVGSQQGASSEKILEYFIGEIHQRFSTIVANFIHAEQSSIFQINAKLDELSRHAVNVMSGEFVRFGIELVNFNVERVSIPESELARFQEVFGRRMEIEQISEARVGPAYATMRTFDTLEKAAENTGGSAGTLLAASLGLGAGVGAGVPLGARLGKSLDPGAEDGKDVVARLQTLKRMLSEQLILQEEFDAKKRDILDEL